MAGDPMAGADKAAELLDVDMDQLARPLPFVALHRRRRIQIAQGDPSPAAPAPR